MLKKILIVSLFGIILLATTTHALTPREFFQKPLPNVIEFMNKVVDWFAWFWSKIVYYADVVFNWTLDSFLINFWKATVWLWNLIKTAFLAGWQVIDAIAKGLATDSDINWQNIQWPWNQ